MPKVNLLQLLEEGVSIVTGCTEPAGIAFCVATAAAVAEGKIKSLWLCLDPGVYRNAAHVLIPGTGGGFGAELAASLGLFLSPTNDGLDIFHGLKPETLKRARRMIERGCVNVHVSQKATTYYIRAMVETDAGTGVAIVAGKHDHVILNRFLPGIGHEAAKSHVSRDTSFTQVIPRVQQLSIAELWALVGNANTESLEIVWQGALVNMRFARYCQANLPQLAGAAIMVCDKASSASEKYLAEATGLTALAVEGRMRGVERQVMTAWGSGNQGLVATIPILYLGRAKHRDEITIRRALALSILVAGKVKSYLGSVSAMCGTSIAGSAGIAAGLVYLDGGSSGEAEDALGMSISSSAGILCDGAKPGCWAKVAPAVETGARAADLARRKIRMRDGDGLVCNGVETTLENLRTVENVGMAEMKMTLASIIEGACSQKDKGFNQSSRRVAGNTPRT